MKYNLKQTMLLMTLSGALFAPTASAVVITQWNFNGASATSVPLDGNSMPIPSAGSGSALLIGGTTGSFSSGIANGGSTDPVTTSPNNYGWQTTAYPTISAANETAGVQFMVSTVGFNSISFGYDQRASNTSSRFWAVNYTLDGTTWLRLAVDNTNSSPGSGTYGAATGTFASTSGDTWFNGRTVNFAGITGASNNPNFGIQIVNSFNGGTGYTAANTASTYAAGGTSRFDMVTFSGLSAGAKNLIWNLTTGGAWNTSTANWIGDATVFADGDNVTFNKIEGGTVNVTGTLSPATVTVSAASGTYTLNSATSSDKISGAGSLTKTGNGILVVAGDNDYAGGTTITGGTLRIDSSASPLGTPLGSGNIAIDGGVLASNSAVAAAIPNAITIGTNGGTIDTGSQNLTINSMPNLAGMLTKSGSGSLLLTSNFNPGPGGGVNVSAGNLILNQTNPSTVNLAGNSSLTGNLVLSNPIRFNVNSSAVLTGTGELQVVQTGTLISQASGNVGGTIAAPIKLNSANVLTGAIGTWSGTSYTSSDYVLTIGGTAGGGLTLNGIISGAGEVDISNNSSTGGGTGYVQLNAVNTYAGNTTINANTPVGQTYSVRLGINNALPATGLIAGTKTGLGAAVLDLNGKSQHLGYLADGGNVIAPAKSLKITNEGTADSTLTLGGTVTPGDAGFSGVIADGTTNKIAVVKNGVNTQLIVGENTYSGGTLISAGILQVGVAGGTAGSLGTGPITNDATLNVARSGFNVANISGSGTTTVTATGASLTASSIRQGSLNIGAGNSVNLAANSTITSKLNTLNIAGVATPTGTLNLANNGLIIDDESQFATIQAQIRNAYNGGDWNGTGIRSSAASAGSTGLGYALASDLGLVGAGYTNSWGVQTPLASDAVIVKYTFIGDSDLDGDVDPDDFSNWFANYDPLTPTATNWLGGDFNYDGFNTADDFSDWFANYPAGAPSGGFGLTAGGFNGASFDSASLSITAVPEPSTYLLGTIGLAIGGVLLRRRRKQEGR